MWLKIQSGFYSLVSWIDIMSWQTIIIVLHAYVDSYVDCVEIRFVSMYNKWDSFGASL